MYHKVDIVDRNTCFQRSKRNVIEKEKYKEEKKVLKSKWKKKSTEATTLVKIVSPIVINKMAEGLIKSHY